MMKASIVSLAAAGLLALAFTPALAHPPIAERPAQEEAAVFEADRAEILAMAGNFKVRFDMQEATPRNRAMPRSTARSLAGTRWCG